MPQWGEQAPAAATPPLAADLRRAADALRGQSVKAVQPEAWVIGAGGRAQRHRQPPPGGSTGVETFLRGLAPFHPPADAFAQHLYTAGRSRTVGRATPSYRTLPDIIGLLDAVRPGLPIMITEFGWTTRPSLLRSGFVTEATQATYLRQAIDEAVGEPARAARGLVQPPGQHPVARRAAAPGPQPEARVDTFVQMPKFVGTGAVAGAGAGPGAGPGAVGRDTPLSRRNQLLISQRITQAAIRRAEGIQRWIDEGIEGRDLRLGALGSRELVPGAVTDRAGPPLAADARDPRPVVVPGRRTGKADRVAVTTRQLLINRRIAQTAVRRLKALKARMDGRLTGGDVEDRTLSQDAFVAGLRALAVPRPTPRAPSVTRVAPAKAGDTSRGHVSRRVKARESNQRIAQAAVRRANELVARIEAGLVARDLRNGTLDRARPRRRRSPPRSEARARARSAAAWPWTQRPAPGPARRGSSC